MSGLGGVVNHWPWCTGTGVNVTPQISQSWSSGMKCHSNEGSAPLPDAAAFETM